LVFFKFFMCFMVKKCFSVYIQLRVLRAFRGENRFLLLPSALILTLFS